MSGRPIRSIEQRVATIDPRRQNSTTYSKATRIRGRKLQAIRKAHFQKAPLCVSCEAKGIVREAVELDHIVALEYYGTEDSTNRQGLCKACHAEKTRNERRRG